MTPTAKRESAGEIAKRYGLADLARARLYARRLHLNALARRASVSYQDSLDVLDPDLNLYDANMLYPNRYYNYFMNDPVLSRRGLPGVETRYMYNRRLAELEAERIAAEERADRVVNRYLTRSKGKKGSLGTDDKEANDKDNEEENEDDINKDDKEEEAADDDLLDEDLYYDGLDPAYYDPLTAPYDMPTWRHARRLYRRRLYPYRFRPLGVTTRLMERRLRGL